MSLGYILAGFSADGRHVWALALTQGLMAGIGVGWVRRRFSGLQNHAH